jgi:outer membrane protein assembly factor BamB
MRRCLVLLFGVVVVSGSVWAAKRPASLPASRPVPRALIMRGVVFEDLNGDGVRNDGEPALRDMPVSDGLSIAKTPEGGQFEFEVRENLRGSVFVCTPAGWRASRSFYVIADFDRFADRVQPADVGLVRDPARNTDRFRFVQVTDTHVTQAADTMGTMAADIDVINHLSDPPLFVVATGDLTNVGHDIEQYREYLSSILGLRCPLYNVVGNHDYAGQLRDSEHYERFLGPPYYSFDVGPYHFIATDVIGRTKDAAGFQRQDEWIEQDIRMNDAGKRLVVLQHYLPTFRELDWWAEHNAAAVFSGHWHGRRERRYKDVLDINSAPLRFGGIDRSPRGFRIIRVEGDQMNCEWRVGNQSRRLEIVHPPIDGQIAGRDVLVQIVAYDTAVPVRRVRYRIDDLANGAPTGGEPIAEGNLQAEGSWSWGGRWAVGADLRPGEKSIHIEATDANGNVWTKDGVFTLRDAPAPTVKPGGAWPFFHNDAGHRGYLPAGPRPPLSLAWATNIGGTIHIASPVIADGRVYAGSSFERSLADCAVVALDLVSGRQIWRAPVDSSIEHSVAAWDGNILAVSQAGTLYCFDREGHSRWTASLDRERNDRWETSAPVTDGKVVYAGRCSGFGGYDLLTGKPIWKQPGGNDWWPSVYSAPSLGSGAVYQGGPFVRALEAADGDVLWSKTKMPVSTVAVVPGAAGEHEQGDRLYVFHNTKTLKCLDGRNGKTVWEAKTDKPDGSGSATLPLGDETGTPAVGEDVVCIGSTQTSRSKEKYGAAMYGVDRATGRLRWRFPVGAEIVPTVPYKREDATVTSSPVIVGEVVYFGCGNGCFYALDTRDGHLLWKYRFGQPIASTAAVSGNTVIVAAWDGTIYALTAAE